MEYGFRTSGQIGPWRRCQAERLNENLHLPHAVRERSELRLSPAALVRKTSEALLDLL